MTDYTNFVVEKHIPQLHLCMCTDCLENYLKKLPNWRYRIKTEEKKKVKKPQILQTILFIFT